MSDAPKSIPASLSLRSWLIMIAITLTVTAVEIVAVTGGSPRLFFDAIAQASWTPQAPDLAPLAKKGPLVVLHVVTVLGALVVGLVLIAAPKGRLLHRVLGWAWVILMVVTAADTLFFWPANGLGGLHVFSIATLITAPLGVWFARTGRYRLHQGFMMGLFMGGLLTAGLLALMPGRAMHAVLFG